jgi:hypothetical protein
MHTHSPNSIHLLLNSTQVLTVYKRINIRSIGCIALLGEIERGLSFVCILVSSKFKRQ